MSWFSRLKNTLNPRRLDHDLEEEIADHLERRASEFSTEGLSGEEAAHKAKLRFGNTTRLREESREFALWTGVESTLRDVRYASRGMRKDKAFTATAVFSLALAIGANTAIYSLVDAAVLRPLPVRNPQQLFQLSWPSISDIGSSVVQRRDAFSYPEYTRYAEVARPVARLALFHSPDPAEIRVWIRSAPVEKVNAAFTSGDGFEVLGVVPAIGRFFSSDEDRVPSPRAVAVISYEFWQRRFQKDPSVIGRFLFVNGKALQITAVAQEGFFGVEPGKFVDLWMPATLYEAQALTDPGWNWIRILGRFEPGASPAQVQALLQSSFHEFQIKRVQRSPLMPYAIQRQFLQSAIEVHSAPAGISDFRKAFSRPLWIVFGVAIGILLIACANVASLLLARSAVRTTEMAMRISLGAARIRLVRQMLTESLVLSTAAGALGWILARGLGPLLVTLLSREGDPVQFVLAIDTRVLAFCIGVSTLSAMLFGLAPAWQASGANPIRALRSFSGQTGKLRMGKVFVSFQVACAVGLVVVGAAFLFSLGNLLRVDPGFSAQNVAVMGITAEEVRLTDDPVASDESRRLIEARSLHLMNQLQSRVASQPGVQAAALAWWPIFQGGGWSQQVILPGRGASQLEEIFYRVSPGYFSTLKTGMLAGRDFVSRDSTTKEPAPVIVNESFARKYFNDTNVLGREFSYMFKRSPLRQVIVGVVADARYYNLRTNADPMVYLPVDGRDSFTLYARSALPLGQMVRLVNLEAHALGSGMRIRDVTNLESIVGNTLLRERLLAGVGGACAFFGLLLAAIGIFGLLSYSVARRKKEIGIRTALGAQRSAIIRMILQDVSSVVLVGLAIGLVAALLIVNVLRALLFDVQPVDPFVIGTAIGLFAATALIASGLPALRAASVDPLLALRQE